MSPTIRLPSRFGRTLTALIACVAVIAVAATAIQYGWPGVVRSTAPAALAVYIAWLAFWRPDVTVSDGGVTLHNVFRTIHLPWPSIERIDTKYALTLHTTYGRYAAWAAPAPGLMSSGSSAREDYRGLPSSTYVGGTVRASDNPATDSGQAALLVRQRWQQLSEAGYLDYPILEANRPTVRIHWVSAAALAVLVAATVIALS